jgi:hypothetical protein
MEEKKEEITCKIAACFEQTKLHLNERQKQKISHH